MIASAIETLPHTKSKAGEAYLRLHFDILYGRLAPGEKLTFSMLKQNYPFGLAPLREALVRLAATGLVHGEEQKGFRVAPISQADLLDLTKTSIRLESDAISSAIENADRTSDMALLAAFHRLEMLSLTESVQSPDIACEWNMAHAAFHDSLVAPCDSPSLLRLRRLLYDQAERYRCFSIGISGGSRDLDGEHRAMMMAVLARNESEAKRLVETHWNGTVKIIIESSKLPQS